MLRRPISYLRHITTSEGGYLMLDEIYVDIEWQTHYRWGQPMIHEHLCINCNILWGIIPMYDIYYNAI